MTTTGLVNPFIKANLHIGAALSMLLKDDASEEDTKLASDELKAALTHTSKIAFSITSPETRDELTSFTDKIQVTANTPTAETVSELSKFGWRLAAVLDRELTGLYTEDDGRP